MDMFMARWGDGKHSFAKGPAAPFIDPCAVLPDGVVVHGRHGWYGAPAYPPPACGYYPYPPCY
ncbi:MAG: hypothetical protein ACKOED_06140 [Aestuariivirga sp.]|uniref:hypothetical protein n=1 Tax=Aestuariivirga sp. TaxID=2650926 RepID=UPI0038CF4243